MDKVLERKKMRSITQRTLICKRCALFEAGKGLQSTRFDKIMEGPLKTLFGTQWNKKVIVSHRHMVCEQYISEWNKSTYKYNK